MAILHLVRHAEPAGAWGEDPDPGLSARGAAQAEACAADLKDAAGLIVTSPLRRCRETAAPLARLRGASDIRIEPAVAEIVAPGHVVDRRAWLADLFAGGRWDAAGLRAWRDEVAATLLAIGDDATVFTHYVAINAAVSVCLGEMQVAVCDPAHASVTVLEARGGKLHLVGLGAQGGRVVI
jgi:broad specificity phosphatase PhoE